MAVSLRDWCGRAVVSDIIGVLLDQEQRLPSSQPELDLGKDPAPDQSTLDEAAA